MSPDTGLRTDDERCTTVRHFAYVLRPFEEAADLLVALPEAVVVGEPGPSGGPVSSLHAHLGRIGLSRSAAVHLGPVSREPNVAHVPLRWEDSERPRLFPVLEAILSLAPLPGLSLPLTQVGLVGRYRPPLGVIGEMADRLGGEDLATEAVAGFVADIADRLERLLPEPSRAATTPEGGAAARTPEVSRILIPVDRLQERPGGAVAVSRRLAATPGVVHSQINPITGMATVEYQPDLVPLEDLLDQLEVD